MKRHSPTNRNLSTRTWLMVACALGALWSIAASAADPNAAKLQSIEVQTLPGQQLRLTLHLSGPAPQPLSFTIDNPARISFDLPNIALALPSRRIDVHTSGLDTILAAEGKDRTRLVLNLDKLVPYDTRVEGNTLVVVVGSANPPPAAAAPPASAPPGAPAAAAG